ncbi:MAG: type II toxin-antitoxin system VapC family toxin [Candidatus Diapherotrites archaeon]|nr:type II toxin-antitoxin system VapC family toxin [Candidatus Diapherotrites archaeon]
MIYIDANVFVYAILDSAKTGNAARKIIGAIQEGKTSAGTSALTFDEIVFVVRKNRGGEAALTAGETFIRMNNLRIFPTDRETITRAIEQIRKYGLHPRDAIHLATMEQHQLTEIISEDRDFEKITKIKRTTLSEF